MSFKPALLGHNETRWSTNGLTFATEEEAKSSAWNTFFNCTHFDEHKAVESDEPVTHIYDEFFGVVSLDDKRTMHVINERKGIIENYVCPDCGVDCTAVTCSKYLTDTE